MKLSEVDQSAFSSAELRIVYPVPNAWGKQGWTFIELDRVHPDLVADALVCAYSEVAPRKLSESAITTHLKKGE